MKRPATTINRWALMVAGIGVLAAIAIAAVSMLSHNGSDADKHRAQPLATQPPSVGQDGAASENRTRPPAAGPVRQAIAPAAGIGSASQMYFVDPRTGLQREPTDDEIQALAAAQAAAAQSITAPEPIVGIDGSPGMRIPDDMATYEVVTKNPDGTISFTHASSRKEAIAQVESKTREEKPRDR
jgi:hypothetical protein